MGLKEQRRLRLAGSYIFLLGLVAVNIFPFYWMFITSLKGGNYFNDPYSLLPNNISFALYEYWLSNPASGFWDAMRNTIFAFAVTLAFALPLGAMAGYALARWKTRLVDVVLIGFFLLQLMPGFALINPQFRLFLALKLVGTLPGLYLLYTSSNLLITIVVLRNFMLTIPVEIEEAAAIDGCSRFGMFWSIMLPLARPALITSGMFIFINIWLEYFGAAQIMRGKYQTLATLIVINVSDFNYRPDLLMSMGVLIVLPLAIIFPFVQRYLVSGLSSGAVKG